MFWQLTAGFLRVGHINMLELAHFSSGLTATWIYSALAFVQSPQDFLKIDPIDGNLVFTLMIFPSFFDYY